jgi:hypothetical protein
VRRGVPVPGEVRRIVLAPRFVSISNTGASSVDLFFEPVPVREYCRGDVVAWATGTVTLVLQEAIDLQTWSTKGSISSGTSQPITSFDPLDTEWVRLKATVGPGDKATIWVVGEFQVRGS